MKQPDQLILDIYTSKAQADKAMRKDGHTIMLIHEFDFADIIDDI